MKVNAKIAAKLVGVALAAVGTVAVLSGCEGDPQQAPVEKTFELKDGTKVTCLVIYDEETGTIIEETVGCPVVVQPTAKKDK